MQERKVIYDNPNFDIMTYFWFLNSLLKGVDNGYSIEINDNKINCIKFNFRNLKTIQLEVCEFVVDRVEDSRMPLTSGAYKDYITTAKGMYRFIIFFR